MFKIGENVRLLHLTESGKNETTCVGVVRGMGSIVNVSGFITPVYIVEVPGHYDPHGGYITHIIAHKDNMEDMS